MNIKSRKMKIGIFDSGLGGLIILKAIKKKLPNFDYVYLGDTKNLPYGNKSQTQIYSFLKKGAKFLFDQNCALVIVACNTASAVALRKIQRKFLLKFYPDRKILGVIRPTIEKISQSNSKKILLIGTKSTIKSKSYIKELKNLDKNIQIISLATPDLVPYLENFEIEKAKKSFDQYYINLAQKNCSIILGCTHYPILKKYLRQQNLKIFSQDEIIPNSLKNYLIKHSEIKRRLSKKARMDIFVTKVPNNYQNQIAKWFSKKTKIKIARLQ